MKDEWAVQLQNLRTELGDEKEREQQAIEKLHQERLRGGRGKSDQQTVDSGQRTPGFVRVRSQAWLAAARAALKCR